ncbi:MAG: hypothetical protein ACRDNK_04370 [Solirubrobacteraceae bacterium]
MSLALVAGAPAAALAARTSVSVRVEGANRTLLSTKAVHTHTGSITKGGTPVGTCPATTAAGALDVATGHHWSGAYSSSVGLSVTQIFGETHTFTSHDYWSIWVNNKFAPAGICGLKLHAGEQLLFAAVPVKGATEYPLVITGPRHATAGHRVALKVTYFNAKGVARPLAGATVHGGGGSALTGASGNVSVTAPHVARLTFTAAKAGYIRSASVTVRVG